MNIALVCIAKNEDHYIKEWCEYNKKLGFDKIFIYENNWRSGIIDPIVETISFDEKSQQQQKSYAHFIKNYGKTYDWAAFFDIDEFLVLKKHKSVKDFVSQYEKHSGIGINWVLFGDNDQSGVAIKDCSLVKRFTKRQIKPNKLIKSIIKIKSCKKMFVHHPDCFIVNTNHEPMYGAFSETVLDDVAQINHYYCKTIEEFTEKTTRGKATGVKESSEREKLSKLKTFDANNFNEIEDLTAYKFFFEN